MYMFTHSMTRKLASTLTRVMPTCTVGRKRCGSSDNCRALAAPGTPLRSMTSSRARRTDTRASSLMANTPLSRISRKTMARSKPNPMAPCSRPGAEWAGQTVADPGTGG